MPLLKAQLSPGKAPLSFTEKTLPVPPPISPHEATVPAMTLGTTIQIPRGIPTLTGQD